MDIQALYYILQETMNFAIPLLLVALGAMFAEKSGVVNIALEGIMIIGAFCGVAVINLMQAANANANPQFVLLIGSLVAIVAGILFSSLLAFSAINMKANQTIGGTAMNLLAPALVVYIARSVNDVKQIQFSKNFLIGEVPFLSDIPVIGDIFFTNFHISTYVSVAILIIAWIVINKTKFGLRLSACGEHPQAADAVGINVYKMRWAGTLISGALGGFGGLIFIISSSVSFNGTVAGYGFLAIAVMIFGQWKPTKILGAAMLFGLAKAIAFKYTSIPFLANLPIANIGYLFKMLPFVVTMIVLIFSSRKSRAPKAEGIPYDKGER